jgi:hypothetical protein
MSDFQRRRLEQRWQELLSEWQQAKNDCEHWNRTHPDEAPLVFDWDLKAEIERAPREERKP